MFLFVLSLRKQELTLSHAVSRVPGGGGGMTCSTGTPVTPGSYQASGACCLGAQGILGSGGPGLVEAAGKAVPGKGRRY